MQYYKFVVYDEPYCIWDVDLAQVNLEFIESMKPEYFENVVQNNLELLESEEKNLAAISIRLTYFHAMETFFSLLCATLQASNCVVAWLQKYPPGSLQKMVKDIGDGKEIMTGLGKQQLSWEDLSNTLNSFVLEDKDKETKVKTKFTKLWRILADDFTNETLVSEYNNLKHGFRIRPGGFHLSMATENIHGVSPPPEDFKSMGRSEFGTSFFMRENICQKGVPHGKHHFKLKKHNVNWDPNTIGMRVILLRYSIQNILSFLRIVNGIKPDTVKFSWPSDLELFEKAFAFQGGVFHMSYGPTIRQEDIEIFTKEEILEPYQRIKKSK
ncbi:hypothetical protein LI82_06605 [Methanococcoides methylutens]|uniref:Uncharacterized protein n=1 Tax=Methanococcoides methylutens TaxID=2226 RepID=A0A099T070_METMT|nr:hypothetical protein [Methanococcoides methylutens]KGK98542.1 hypothetical protein LI82_06605 [Methanococcoides methylutens]